ncbi:MAG: hypothetical protein ACI4IQ_06165, partial [Eubacterium sp.]
EQQETELLDCNIQEETVPATPDCDGYYREYCTNCDYDYKKTISKPKTIKLSLDMKSYTNEFAYTGKAIYPNVKVLDANGVTIPSSDYMVKMSNNINVGTATVTVELCSERYSGVMTEYFTIKQSITTQLEPLQASSIIRLLSGTSKNSIEIDHTCSQNSTAYDVQYSTNSSFSGARTVRVKALNNGSFCKSNIKVEVPTGTVNTQKKYYVRIRAVDAENNRITAWSQPRTVQIYIKG